MTSILVVEDERDLALGIQANLEVAGYAVKLAASGERAAEALAQGATALVILDLMLPDMSGYEVLEDLRGSGSDIPVLILSARGEEVDKVRGFRAGADDYVTKPFGIMELLVRIEALLRRRSGGPPASVSPPAQFSFGNIVVDRERRVIVRDGVEVRVSPRAFDLLVALLRKPDRVVSRQDLLHDVWGYAPGVTTRTVDVHVAELRRCIEHAPRSPEHLMTVWKAGYRLRV